MKEEIQQLVTAAQKIVVLQADNPDADSLGAALALEQILSELGKSVYLYCAVETPGYLRYLAGWSRIQQELPSSFDLSIIVDASTLTLFGKLQLSGTSNWLATKPCIVIDHHATTDNSITYADVTLNQPTKSSTGEVIFDLCTELQWPLDTVSGEYLMTCILGDTQGLTNPMATASTYRVMASLTELGVNRPNLEELRREASKMQQSIFRYKSQLMSRVEFLLEGQLAIVDIPQAEINEYSPLYNPGPLVQPDMLNTEGVLIGIVFKKYDDGKITAMIRCNSSAEIAGKLADRFGGGGHGFAAGFKITDNQSFDKIKNDCIETVKNLLQENSK